MLQTIHAKWGKIGIINECEYSNMNSGILRSTSRRI